MMTEEAADLGGISGLGGFGFTAARGEEHNMRAEMRLRTTHRITEA